MKRSLRFLLILSLFPLSSHSQTITNSGFEEGTIHEGVFVPDDWNVDDDLVTVASPGYESRRCLTVVGNGDGRFIYPPKNWTSGEKLIEGPVDSIRWEMLREGIEDWEYFNMLQTALDQGNVPREEIDHAKQLLEIPPTIIQSLTEFTKDPEELFKRRYAIARLLERINWDKHQ